MAKASLHNNPAAISPLVLEWALTRAESNQANLAKAAGTSIQVIRQWLDGSRQPSFRQARAAAEHLHVPFGFLFLQQPPPESLPIPDFRRVYGHEVGEISTDLRDVVLATLRRQDWLIDDRESQGATPISVVGSLAGTTSVPYLAGAIRRSLDLTDLHDRPRNADEFLRQLTDRAEALGISVLRSGIVGLNTHRKLSVAEFRGFSLSNKIALFVFINGADAKTGQIFTLIHEFVHIWLGESGISGSVSQAQDSTESLCNQVAAEVLVPAALFASFWDDTIPLDDAIRQAAAKFRVSRYVIVIRAFESGLLSRPTLDRLLAEFDSNARSRKASDGGDFYRTAITRNGRLFTSGVVSALERQRVLIGNAASLLEVRPSHLARLTQELRRRA